MPNEQHIHKSVSPKDRIEMDVLNRKQTSDWKHIEQIVRVSGCYLGIAWLHCQPDLITWVKMLYKEFARFSNVLEMNLVLSP